LGIYYTDKGDYENAIESLMKASKINPDLYRPYQNIGRVYSLMGDIENAKFYYQKAFDLGDREPKFLENLEKINSENK